MVILQPNFTAAVDAPIPFLFMLCVLGGAPLSSGVRQQCERSEPN
jgi:hypothetical protein